MNIKALCQWGVIGYLPMGYDIVEAMYWRKLLWKLMNVEVNCKSTAIYIWLGKTGDEMSPKWHRGYAKQHYSNFWWNQYLMMGKFKCKWSPQWSIDYHWGIQQQWCRIILEMRTVFFWGGQLWEWRRKICKVCNDLCREVNKDRNKQYL